MEPAQEWTGRTATALRKALRMTVDRFASALRVAPRTVANWAASPDTIPRVAVQDALDELLGRAAPAVRSRFQELAAGQETALAGHAQALRVAISVVTKDGEVLLVRRRDDGAGISWQFPAGVIKPGERPEDVAVRETLGETGVHCTVRERIGSRLHPTTGVYCDYFACDFLTGVAENRDTVENAGVAWVPRQDLTRFVARDKIYPPILRFLEEQRDAARR